MRFTYKIYLNGSEQLLTYSQDHYKAELKRLVKIYGIPNKNGSALQTNTDTSSFYFGAIAP
jgi:hypothetical protein